MKEIQYAVTNGHATRIFTNKSSAEGWLAEEIQYAGRYYSPDISSILAKTIVNTGKPCVIKDKKFGITTL